MPTNVVSQIQIPGGTVYDIKPSSNPNINTNGIYYVSASGTASAWTGTLDGLTEYYDGLKLVVYNNTGVASNAAFTLKLNSLSAIPVKRYGTTDGSAVSIAGVIYLCYVGGKFIESHYVNTTYNLQNVLVTINKPYIESTGIHTNSLVGHTIDGKMAPFTATSGTGTGKNVTTYKFPIGQTLFIREDAISAGQTTAYYTFYQAIVYTDIRYCMCNWNASRVSTTTEVEYFMHVSVDHDAATFSPLKDTRTVNNIVINDHIVTKSLDRNELNAGNFYIHVGYRYYDSTSYPFYTSIDINNPLYYYDGTNLIEYEIWKSQQAASNYNYADSPTAAMDIYASPEYPVFVCISPQNNYSNYNSQVPCSSGTNMLYDILVSTLATGTPEMDIDWGYAMLVHDVSMGQKVPDQYLLKRGKYTLHTSSSDTTLQGSLNSVGGITNSVYRMVDANLAAEISSYVTQHPNTDGPTLYMNAIPFDYANSGFTRLFPNGPSVGGKQINSMASHTFSCFSFMGKANLDVNSQPSSITVDFTENTIYESIYGADDESTIQYINGNPIGISEEANPGFISENDALSPIAITDIYASPEYPALVCVSPRDEYNRYNGLGIGAIHGTNLLCDYACMGSCWPGFDQDFGYALLIHDVSMGQRVPDSYLLKQGNYPIHEDQTDTTKQGALNFVPDGGEDEQSVYRFYDEYIAAKVRDLNLSSNDDGPMIYMRPYPINYETNVTDLCAGNMDVVKGTPNMYYTTQFHVKLGKGVLDSSGNLISITVDLTDDEVYGTDASGNITYINGSATGIGGNMSPSAIPESFLNNPVSGGGPNLVAGEDISTNTIVCLATDGLIYNVNSLAPGSESLNVVLDWGLAVYIGETTVHEAQTIPSGTLMQQCTIPYEYPSGWSVSGVHTMCVLYNHTGTTGALSISGQLSTLDTNQLIRDYHAYIYAGVADGSVLHVDFSNHDFVHLTPTNKVALINGRSLLGKDGSTDSSSSYDNPVSGDALNPRAGVRIPARSFVIMSKDDGLLYPINYSEDVININFDWGAAYLTAETLEGDSPAVGTLLQQCAIPASDVAFLNIDVSNVTNNQRKTYYLRCTNATSDYVRLTDSSLPAASDELHKLDTLLYVGTRDGSSSINVDFSNHDFLGMMDFNTNSTRITAINGRAVGISQPTVNLSHYESMLTSVKTITKTDSSILTLVIPTQGVWVVNAYATIDASGSDTSARIVRARLATANNTSTAIANCYAITGAKTCLGAADSSNGAQNISMQTTINVTTAPLHVHLIMRCSLARGANVAITSEDVDVSGNPYATMISCFKIAEAQIV